jgi:hypothetical protein
MSEIPERIEREMFEIRSRMAPDVRDLKQHTSPKVIGEQVKRTARQRVRDAVNRVKSTLRTKQQGFVDSAKRQINSAREAGRKRDPSAFTDAVKSDPKPLALLAIVLAITLLMARKVTNGKGD